jgi:SAM-dependent methyltransferase
LSTCDFTIIDFFVRNCELNEFRGKRVLDVGSRFINGSIRPLVEKFLQPCEYVGIDLEPGRYVDKILNVEDMLREFGGESFDVVISTELLEHVPNWRLAVGNMKGVLRKGGVIYVTTRSYGFPYHGYPYDFWRYEVDDAKRIFSDFHINIIERDHDASGVLLKARKPSDGWNPIDLSGIELYSVILGKRCLVTPSIDDLSLSKRLLAKATDSHLIRNLHRFCRGLSI